MISEALPLVVEGKNLTSELAEEAMREMMSGEASPTHMASFLTAMRMKGETKDELLGFLRCMRSMAKKVQAPEGAVDLCGTGGDGLNTFNISTAAAFVVAAAGVPVAKHGNRAVSSKSGSADVLSAMGIPVELGSTGVERSLRDTNIGFMFAPGFHQSMKNVMTTRRELGFRTFFNILGPMANPASVKRQLIGVYDPNIALTVAEVLNEIGTEHAMVVHGSGTDEITNLGPTEVTELRRGKIEQYILSPAELGLDLAEPGDLAGGGALRNARTILEILSGESSSRADVVALNSAAALYVAGRARDIHDGLSIAQASIRGGAARAKLAQFHDACVKLESMAQLEVDVSHLRGKRVQPYVLRARCAEISEDLARYISKTEGGPEHIDRIDPDVLKNPTILTVLTLSRLSRVLSDLTETRQEHVASERRLSEAIEERSGIAIIGEYKPRSPATSDMIVPPEPIDAADAYSNSGIAGVSVLAEEDFFAGGVELFKELRFAISKPMLFKDFVTSNRQVQTARNVGADAVLLVAKAVRADALNELVDECMRIGVEPLVEVHDNLDLEKVASIDSYDLVEMVGVNGRDLRTLDVNLERAIDLRKRVSDDKLVIAESGVASPNDLRSLKDFDGVLIGSMFMRSDEIARTVSETVSVARGVVE